MASEGLHEPAELLSGSVVDHHRAIVSLGEELEAVDWYDQRVSATNDASLAAVLAHNRDEEKEHAAMTLEWLRRRDAALDRHLRTYLFTSSPITEIETEAEAEASGGIGSGSGSGSDLASGSDPGAGSGADAADAGDAGGAGGTGGVGGSLGIGSLRGIE